MLQRKPIRIKNVGSYSLLHVMAALLLYEAVMLIVFYKWNNVVFGMLTIFLMPFGILAVLFAQGLMDTEKSKSECRSIKRIQDPGSYDKPVTPTQVTFDFTDSKFRIPFVTEYAGKFDDHIRNEF
ncbi:delta(9)-fatty-acid desaturase [Acrasis kona]|uniref:Delta(9)-fatty-acid desaturase n=1 Tax=Acrasis kona TaxID=1008807 RepID=A0AAW2Z0Y5_9EUKA